MNEQVYFGEQRVAAFGLRGVGVGDVGDLLAYRQEWDSFITAHAALWQYLNGLFESVPEAQKCPAGIFDVSQIQGLPPATQAFCADLKLTRILTSDTNALGILKRWNAYKNLSSAEILSGADSILKWYQQVVLDVGSYKDDLVRIAKFWGVTIELPDVPTFSVQQEIISRIEGAYVTTKGILKLIGYGVGQTLATAADTAQATAEGLTEAAKQIPKTARWMGIAAAVTAVVVAGGLIIYYKPRKARAAA